MRSNSSIDVIDVHRMLIGAVAQSGSQAAWARKHGVSPQFVNLVLNAKRTATDNMLAEVGLKKRALTVYERMEGFDV